MTIIDFAIARAARQEMTDEEAAAALAAARKDEGGKPAGEYRPLSVAFGVDSQSSGSGQHKISRRS